MSTPTPDINYRSMKVDTDRSGTEVWNASARLARGGGIVGYGRGASKDEAEQRAREDLNRKVFYDREITR
ncbi:putative dsRNA-binding protein [Rhodococcus sp. 11-3]|uniref:putative dsRNA-binding protein n=1 Tax=Rhodococcus sp. 11-3 TaxID=2854796 RepID=UPI00203E11B5|nr:putative dsRNA-binding protein [Rhodococcus sp. 11-3]USC17003.1 hypothetical protein KZJ41_09115 [Rhodococcus sp. 11-3]